MIEKSPINDYKLRKSIKIFILTMITITRSRLVTIDYCSNSGQRVRAKKKMMIHPQTELGFASRLKNRAVGLFL